LHRYAAQPPQVPAHDARAPAVAGPRSDARDAPAPAGTPARHRNPVAQAAEAAAAGFRGARAASMPAGSEEHRTLLPADHSAAVDARWPATAAGAARAWLRPPPDHSARSASRAPQVDHSRREPGRRKEKVGPDIDQPS